VIRKFSFYPFLLVTPLPRLPLNYYSLLFSSRDQFSACPLGPGRVSSSAPSPLILIPFPVLQSSWKRNKLERLVSTKMLQWHGKHAPTHTVNINLLELMCASSMCEIL